MTIVLSNCLHIIFDGMRILAFFLNLLYQNFGYCNVERLYLQRSKEAKIQKYNTCLRDINTTCSNITYDISWKCIEIFTIAKEIYKKNMLPQVHLLTNNYFKKEIILVKSGSEVSYLRNWDEYVNHEDKNVDMILYTKFHDTEDKKNYTIIGDNNLQPKSSMHEEKCSISFIIFQLTVNCNKYDINLKEPFNFLLKNNTLKHSFFKWYMKRIYDITLEQDSYSVYYMTQDMTISTLNSPFFIKFNEDSITSFSSGKPKKNLTIKESIVDKDDKEESSDGNGESSDDKEESSDGNGESSDGNGESSDDKEDVLDEDRKNVLINDIVRNEKLKRRTRVA